MTNLISTIISSTAALVAIIGGFLVSRVITLSSERNAIVKRLREINNELENKQEMLDRVQLILLEDDVDDFIKDHAEEILMYDKDIKIILQEDDSVSLTSDELEPYIKRLNDIFDNLDKMIESTSSNYRLPADFDTFIKDNNLKVENYKDWYEIVYDIIYNNIPDDPPIDPKFGLMPSFRIRKIPVTTLPNVNHINWYRDKIKERDTLSDDIYFLSRMKCDHKKLLDEYGNISGLWSGLLILIYSSIVGIIVPILLLPYPLGKYDDISTKKVLLLLFFSGLASLFIYLGISMYKLTKDD